MKTIINTKLFTVIFMLLLPFLPKCYATDYEWYMGKVDKAFESSDDKVGIITQRLVETDIPTFRPADDQPGVSILSRAIEHFDLPRVIKFLKNLKATDYVKNLLAEKHKTESARFAF
jgi:hypothetical protein